MLIGYEASALQGYKSGVGYYAENLLAAMMRVAPQHDYVLFSNRDMTRAWQVLGNERLYRGRYFPVRLAWMQGVLPGTLRRVRPDVCHFPNYLAPLASRCPSVVTLHDMTLFVTPRFHHWKKLVLDRTLIPLVARRAQAIVTVSHSAGDDIVRYLGVPSSKVHVIMNAVSPVFHTVTDKPQLEAVRARYGLGGPYILYVGTIEPRKNLARLIRAFRALKKRGLPHKLVLVGQSGWHSASIYAEVEKHNLASDVIFTGYVPFEDLPALYSGASAMAFPSLYEGFGMPVLEAMSCGTPVVTSHTSALAEVADGAALLVDPLSGAQIAGALYRVCTDGDLARDLSVKGRARATQFTWENAARATLDVYEGLAAHRTIAPKPLPIGTVRSQD
ncbi:MAG TPA: glycosyltransferase family 1 protein [Chloroflexia bacterium]|nr:glycosyltransferase family 1 protein [Chloroflexia bacterium]